jgi:AcrR family transcriptional regulator
LFNQHPVERRTELSTANRERIVQAAFTLLSRQGYENTSIKEIAEEAGVAQGLVHYYFKSKQQLVLAVLFMCCARMELPRGVEGEAGALAAFEHFKASLRDNRDTHALYLQLIGIAPHDKEVGAGVLEFVRSDRGFVEEVTRQVLAEREEDSSRAAGFAAAIWGAILGIIAQSLVDPDFNADEAVDALAAMSLAAVSPPARGA